MGPAYWIAVLKKSVRASQQILVYPSSMSGRRLLLGLVPMLLLGCSSTRPAPSNELPLADREDVVSSPPVTSPPEAVASAAAEADAELAKKPVPQPPPAPKPERGTTLPTYEE